VVRRIFNRIQRKKRPRRLNGTLKHLTLLSSISPNRPHPTPDHFDLYPLRSQYRTQDSPWMLCQ